MNSIEYLHCIKINRPQWFQRDDWKHFLDGTRSPSSERADSTDEPAHLRPATWHAPGSLPNEYSDVFTVYDNGEGPDAETIPADIWDEIGQALTSLKISYAVVWITNLVSVESPP